MRRFLKTAMAAAAFALIGSAQAAVLDFEGLDAPFFQHYNSVTGEHEVVSDPFWINTYRIGGSAGDLTGNVIDGSALADACADGLNCPKGNSTNFFGGLNDGYIVLGRTDNAAFRVTSFDAAVIGKTSGQTYPATSAYLELTGFTADGGQILTDVVLTGPTSGSFAFKSYNLLDLDPVFAGTDLVAVRFVSYAFNGSGYSNGGGFNNFALDNVVAVPEPTTWALMGLGLLAVGAAKRRRQAV